jgi:hypothetical protein
MIFCFLTTLQLRRRVVTIDGYTDVEPKNEKQLLKAVAAQPVGVGICGSERAFQLYSKVGPPNPQSQRH